MALPPELRDYSRRLDKKETAKLFQELAERYPEKYREVAKQLSDVAREVAYEEGGFSFSVNHLRPIKAAEEIKRAIRRDISRIRQKVSDPEERKKKIIETINRYQDDLTKAVFEEAKKQGNPLAEQVISGSRGSPMNLRSLLAADLLYEDNRGNTIPIPILDSYADGLSMAEYWAGAYGARKGIVDVKEATRNAGALGKRLRQVTHRLIVTALDEDDDDPDPEEQKYRSPAKYPRGMLVDTEDPGNIGSLLAVDTAGIPRNTPLTADVIKELKKKGVKKIIIRSPISSHPKYGGVYARDAGVRERGGLPPLGDYIGLAASDSIGEKISQGQLSSKHTGGVAGQTKAVSGFNLINQLLQVPKHFPGGAAHAQQDGVVKEIKDAPQGGKYVYVGDAEHYVPPDQEVTVKKGQMVEAGDTLSNGLPNPAELVRHKGIGEGRRAFIFQFSKALNEAGLVHERRNLELLARGLIDRVQMVEDYEDFLPEELVPYSTIERRWQPRNDAREMNVNAARGKYLEVPVLHYTIGTQIRPSVASTLKQAGINKVLVHSEPPPFKPVMIRSQDLLQSDPDFITRHLGSNLRRTTLQAVAKGMESNPRGTSFVPAMLDLPNFGDKGLTKGWKAPPLKPEERVAPERGPSSLLEGLDEIK